MDPQLRQMYDAANEYEFVYGDFFTSYSQSQYLPTEAHHDTELNVSDISFLSLSPDPGSFASPSAVSYETDSTDDQDSGEMLKYLNMFLVEENTDEMTSTVHDPLLLQATERSLYELIGQKYPSSHTITEIQPGQSNDTHQTTTESSSGYTNGLYDDATSFVDSQWVADPNEKIAMLNKDYKNGVSSNLFVQEPSRPLSILVNGSQGETNPNVLLDSLGSRTLVQNMFTHSESILQFQRGVEEASKFLPPSNKLIIDLDKYVLPEKSQDILKVGDVKIEKNNSDGSDHPLRGKRHDYPRDGDSGNLERSSKQSAISVEDVEVELCEYLERALSCLDDKVEELCTTEANLPGSKKSSPQGTVASRSSRRSRTKKSDSNGDTVDLRSLLISCAQTVAVGDRRTAEEQLKQIEQHLLQNGAAHNRVAHLFARGLRARLFGTGTELYASLTQRKMTASELLRTYKVYLSTCPFKKLPIFFAKEMIILAASEASTLHIVDFGILYGFQWPVLIQHLSQRPGGSPKLRITGIELPQRGFRPAERIEETGRHLKKYCERFGVPFEYKAIASQNWETIKLEDLNIVRGEVLCVNCLFRLGRFLDESVVVDSPRDKLLQLIRKMKPNVFVNTITNGSYNAPIFLTRFKEALFHFSMLFDVLDNTLASGIPELNEFIQEQYALEVINVVACEGTARVERPETYKQWNSRHLAAGFKPYPLKEETMEKLRSKSKATSHIDFLFDKDGNWMLQGWKGRILSASSCWVSE